MENKLYLIKSGDGNFIEETETIIGVTGGNVGIGTTDPVTRLEVDADLQTVAKFKSSSTGSGAFALIAIESPSATSNGRTRIGADVDDLFFNTSNGASDPHTSIERLRITSSGNVGIGTTDPVDKLQVGGTGWDNRGDARVYGTFEAFVPESGAYSKLTWGGGNTRIDGTGDKHKKQPAMIINRLDESGDSERTVLIHSDNNTYFNGGNVGIGTAGPTRLLNIQGEGDVSNQSGASIRLDNSTNDRFGLINFDDDQQLNIWAGGSGGAESIVFRTKGGSSTEQMRIDTDGNVGIGTNNPVQALEISGTNRNIITRDGNITAGRSMRAGYQTTFAATIVGLEASGDDGTKKWEWYNNAGTSGNNHFSTYERTSGNEGYRFTIQEGGNVGIGTTNPNHDLTIVGEANLSTIGTNDSALRFHPDTGRSIQFYTNDTARVYINSEGNVGIGTTNPSETLEVNGNIASRITNGSSWNYVFGANDGNGLIIGKMAGNTSVAGDRAHEFYTNFTTDSHIYRARSTGGAVVNQINTQGNSFFNGGNVGIGTTNPAGKLTVKSNQGSSAIMLAYNHLNSSVFNFFENANGDGVLALGDASGWDDVTTFPKIKLSTYHRTYFNGGNVGIGTTNPAVKLHTYETGSGEDLRVGFTATNSGGTGVNAYIVYDPDADFLAFSPTKTSSARLGIDKHGNVGIGTTSPTAALQVYSENGGSDITITKKHTDDTTIVNAGLLTDPDGDAVLVLNNNVGNTRIRLEASGDSYLNGGNVGIGTTDPAGTLDVFSERTAGDLARIDINPSSSGDPAGLHIRNTNANMEEDAAYFKITDQDNNHKFRINNNGNVGIGTANPDTSKLHVAGGHINLDDDNALAWGGGVHRPAIQGNKTDKSLKFYTEASPSVIIASGGNVGIGTMNPTGKLEIGGNGEGIVLNSPDGTKYLVTVNNGGSLTTTAV